MQKRDLVPDEVVAQIEAGNFHKIPARTLGGCVEVVQSNTAGLLRDLARDLKACRDGIRFLLSFVPEWAQDVPDGLCPTMYGTNTAEGDREVKARVDEIRACLPEPAGEEG